MTLLTEKNPDTERFTEEWSKKIASNKKRFLESEQSLYLWRWRGGRVVDCGGLENR
jgi:hypothetical protein